MNTKRLISGLILVLLLILGACSAPTNSINSSNNDTAVTGAEDGGNADAAVSPGTEASTIHISATLSEAEGEIIARQNTTDEFFPVGDGFTVHVHGQLSTGISGRGRLDISDGSIVRLGSNTLFTLEGQENDDGSLLTKLRLELGQLWVILKGGALEIETPSGVASVRGSYLSVSVNAAGVVVVTCLEGECTLGSGAGEVSLVAGQSAEVTNINFPPNPGKMDDDDVDDWLDNNPEATVVVIPLTATVSATLPDFDFDGVPDDTDRCPKVGNQGYGIDVSGCPLPPPNDDPDGDGFPNEDDKCPRSGDLGYGVDEDGCPVPAPDADGDGYPDPKDACPKEGDEGRGLDARGCPIPEDGGDFDGDGFLNEKDKCPRYGDMGNGLDGFGCPLMPTDSDEDGFPDEKDKCPAQGDAGYGVDFVGCPISPDDDYDDDGVPNRKDDCPKDGDYGYGVTEAGCPIRPTETAPSDAQDTDGDGVTDDEDKCPKLGDFGYGVDKDGCPADSDEDGYPDGIDQCPKLGDGGYGLDHVGCPRPAPDKDGDGFTDDEDKCPAKGDGGYGLDNHGCPLPAPSATPVPDRDGDGVPDSEDKCPKRGDEGNGLHKTGCPIPDPSATPESDGDGDGVPDKDDECPNFGDLKGFGVDKDGCPNDKDGDGVPDFRDDCRDDDGDGKVNAVGCPLGYDMSPSEHVVREEPHVVIADSVIFLL